jgi:hypothetical protein
MPRVCGGRLVTEMLIPELPARPAHDHYVVGSGSADLQAIRQVEEDNAISMIVSGRLSALMGKPAEREPAVYAIL